jgi:hypothetical protein
MAPSSAAPELVATDYIYGVFVSYPSGFLFDPWVKEIFLPLFEAYLTNELNRPVSVFYDRTEISGGDVWPQELRRALVFSRALVGIWAPAYFFPIGARRRRAS